MCFKRVVFKKGKNRIFFSVKVTDDENESINRT